MYSIQPCPLPDGALLGAYRSSGAYTDCYASNVAGPISHEQFVTAFYTTSVFKMERKILQWALSKPSTDAQAKQLAAGAIDEFAAWTVEKRSPDQLLMCDLNSRTRSWLMVAPVTLDNGPGTRLYFGSAVVPVKSRKTGKAEMGPVFRALLGFHQIYSRVLLHAAIAQLETARAK